MSKFSFGARLTRAAKGQKMREIVSVGKWRVDCSSGIIALLGSVDTTIDVGIVVLVYYFMQLLILYHV